MSYKIVSSCDTTSSGQVERIFVLVGDPSAAMMIDAISNGYDCLIEESVLSQSAAKSSTPSSLSTSLQLKVSTKTAYRVDLVEVLDYFLLHQTTLHPILCEHILTTAHEGVMNAVLWNNLEIHSILKKEEGLNFDSIIRARLKDDQLSHRLLEIIINIDEQHVQVTIKSSHGTFDLNESLKNAKSPCQGLSIMRAFASEILTDDEGRILHLRFLR